MSSSEYDLTFVIGPTAVGKSARAMELARARGAEIISADSRHVYRRMDIGTNKPTPAERIEVPHHLLDLREPDQAFSLAEYLAAARQAIRDVGTRGRPALVVGGTGQYVRALIEGWQTPEVPPHEEIRARLLAEQPDALRRMLLEKDPAALETIDPRNLRRVVRALEVMQVTGQRWSALQRREPMRIRPEQLVYLQLPRDALYARADARIAQMVAQGWPDEARHLLEYLASKGVGPEHAMQLPSFSALGYRQMAQVARGQLALDAAVEQIKRDTRRFIRMQDVWFRRIVAGS